MRRIGRGLAAIGLGWAMMAGPVQATQVSSTAPATAQVIIDSISARVKPSYPQDLRDYARAALKLRGRERLRRLLLVECEFSDISPEEAKFWLNKLKEIASEEHDLRYSRLADVELTRFSSADYESGIRDLRRKFGDDADWMVRVFSMEEVVSGLVASGHPHDAIVLVDKARAQIPPSDPDAAQQLNFLARGRAYALSDIGDMDGALRALSDAEFQYRHPVMPVGAIGTLAILAKIGIRLEDEGMARGAYATLRHILPVGKDPDEITDDIHHCQSIEQMFGTPERLLTCGKGVDFARLRPNEYTEFAYASRGLAYAQLGRTKAAEADAARLAELARTGIRLEDIPPEERLRAWLAARRGHAVEAVTILDRYWKRETATRKREFRKIVPELTGALQKELDLSRRNAQQQSTIILFQWGMGVVVALICAATVAVLIWQRRLNRELLAANARAEAAQHRAEEANALKSQFLANVSHEVRTPLNGVLGMIQAIAADELNPVQRERLEVLRGSSRGMLTILNDLLDLAKIEAGKLTLESVEFDLAPVVEGSRHAFWAAAEAKGLDLELTVEADARGLYRGDPTRLRQVVDNLVSNAIKFTSEGGVYVTFAATGAGTGLRLSVRDTGIGLTPEAAGKIFAKFEQADASTTRKFGGTGLGLSICRELVHAFGGEITVTSLPGEGTTFTAELPLPRIGDSPAPGADADGAEAAGLEEAGEGLRILAAEDHPVNQLVLRTLLSQLGCEVTLVGDGAQALEAFRTARWDVVLMDIQMPNMDGLEATRAIRALERGEGLGRTPLVALTANAMPDQIAEYRAAGFDDHLSKPIDAGDLLAVLNRALAGYAEMPEREIA